MQATTERQNIVDIIGAEAWVVLRASMAERRYEAGDVIIAQGTLEPEFHIIVSGHVSVIAANSRGIRRELATAGPGEPLGDMALLTGEPASADVIATTPVTTYSVRQDALATLDELRSRLFEALAALLAMRLKHTNARLIAHEASTIHLISIAPADVVSIARLPQEISRVTGRAVLTVLVDDSPDLAENVALLQQNRADVVTATSIPECMSIVNRAGEAYERILVLASPEPRHSGAGSFTSTMYVVHEDTPVDVPGEADLAVLSPRPSTVPSLHYLSLKMRHRVTTTVPLEPTPPGPRDPIGRLARIVTGRRVGLALGAGAAKGFAHMGALRAFAELGVEIDVISGCSIGAAIAAGWAAGYSVEELSQIAKRIATRAVRPTLPMRSFLSNHGIREELEALGGDKRFEDLDIPLAICATDIFRRSPVTFTSGLIWPRILASMAIPGIYPPLRAGDSYLVDGAVLNPVPAKQCRALGAGIVIAVRLTGTSTSPREALDFDPSRPLTTDTIMRCFEIMQNHVSEVSKSDADVPIEVCIDRGGLRDFGRAVEIMNSGYTAVRGMQSELASALPYVRAAAI